MSRFWALAFFIFLFIGHKPAISAPEMFGRYIGVLKHGLLKHEQLAKLDFILSRNAKNQLDLKAVLTLFLGDFGSEEYVSYHYDRVRFDGLTGNLVFDDADQPLSIFVTKFGNGKLVGDVSSLWAFNKVGTLELSQSETVLPSAPLIGPLMGEYEGVCGKRKATLQLGTYRSTAAAAHLAQPFSSYTIRGNLSVQNLPDVAINLPFMNGAYNFFAQKEQLVLSQGIHALPGLTCTMAEKKIECTGNGYVSSCIFDAKSNLHSDPVRLSPIQSKPGFGTSTDGLNARDFENLKSGNYYGYVFHERRGIYQPASLSVKVFQDDQSEDGRPKLSAHAKLYFGGFDSIEVVPYRFNETHYPDPLNGRQPIVFSRMDENVDAVVQILDVDTEVLKGNWYSILFGRVGPFVLQKDTPPALPKDAKIMLPLSGGPYYGFVKPFIWDVTLQVSPGALPPGTTENPFFPNLIGGGMRLEFGAPSVRIVFNDGSYDFYTGRFGVTTDSGMTWIGRQLPKDLLELFFVTASVVVAPPKLIPQIFVNQKNTP